MSRYFRFGLLFTGVVISLIHAQEGSDISINSQVDRSTITIGDLIKYTVEVKRSLDIEVDMPELGANLGAFELRDYSVHEPVTEGDVVTERVDYTISTFEVGEFEIPALTYHYKLPNDSVKKELRTQKITIMVESMKPSEAGDIKDIKLPLDFPEDYRRYIIWASIAFAFLVLSLIIFYIRRRRKAGKGILPQKVEPPRPAHDLAIEALNALRASSLLAEGKIKEYYIELSEIIRRYIEGRYFIIALEMTTFELINELKMSDIDPTNIDLIQVFLAKCDLVKFAKHQPSPQQHEENLSLAFELVAKTRILYDLSDADENGAEEINAGVSEAIGANLKTDEIITSN